MQDRSQTQPVPDPVVRVFIHLLNLLHHLIAILLLTGRGAQGKMQSICEMAPM
jgi:hypothetical protein